MKNHNYNLIAFFLLGSISLFGQKYADESQIPIKERTQTIQVNDEKMAAFSAPLVIVDGKSYGRTSFCKLDDLTINGKKFNVDDIEAIDILKSKEAAYIYGDKGKNGVILITTKNGIVKKNK